MPKQIDDGRQGPLEMLILKALTLEPMHGWGISLRLQQLSREVLQINQGTLYPALHRMERAGWIVSDWRPSENNRRAKYYTITKTGRQQLAVERENWAAFARAIEDVMATA
ncbi:MAG TPA: PadR family transcriptional regulator [Gemmatimonadaceae bacterium]|nr:PadR family transcriptional regulator [Gemmatimonadaceae bacterium]